MALVPKKSGGSSRKSYQQGYSKSSNAKQSKALGKLKLRSDVVKPSRKPGGGASMTTADFRMDPPEIHADFGHTGYTKEDYS